MPIHIPGSKIKLKAKLLPLGDKYHRTEIEIVDAEDGVVYGTLQLKLNGTWPSSRELDRWQAEHSNRSADESDVKDIMFDDFESAETFHIANVIINALHKKD